MKSIDDLAKEIMTPRKSLNRREFFKNTGQGLLAASVAGGVTTISQAQESPTTKSVHPASDTTPIKLEPIFEPVEQESPPLYSPKSPDERLGFALVGLGHLTLEELMPAFGKCKYAKPVALVSGSPEKAQKVASQYGINPKNLYDYDNFDSIKDNPEVDVVYIVLPNNMHEEYVKRAAKAGKHVLCEKPMTTNAASAQRMVDACKEANVKLMVAYRIQYEPNNRQIMEWVRDKKYGKTRMIDMMIAQNSGGTLSHWRFDKEMAGGGALPDIGLYCSNTARFLLGEEPEWIQGMTYSTPGDKRFEEVEETCMFQMRFPSGTVVNATACYSVHSDKRYRCHGDKGGHMGCAPAFTYHGIQMEAAHADGMIEYKSNPTLAEQNQFSLEIDHMAQCVMNDKTPYTPGEEGVQDHKIMDAIYESARTGKPIQLEVPDQADAFRGTSPDEISS